MEQLQRYRVPIIVALLAVVGYFVYSVLRPAQSRPALTVTLRPTAPPAPTPTRQTSIQVYVSGAVQRPDVYSLPIESIVRDAMQAAGGPSADADLDRINLAARLSDGMQVHFPRQGEAAAPDGLAQGLVPAAGPIDINTATLDQLDTLSSIGPAIAQSIVYHRQANGPFQAIEQIKDVKGIGDALFEKIKDHITVGP